MYCDALGRLSMRKVVVIEERVYCDLVVNVIVLVIGALAALEERNHVRLHHVITQAVLSDL